MKIAVVGCSHGELDPIYDLLQFIEAENGVKAELLLICGDFQAVRNNADFYSMAVPPKFRKLNTFYKYYSGVKTAPVPTIIIGGNHEASNFMQELPYGGWIAPNIYYLGFAGCVQFRGLRIAGMSGIYKHHDYHRGHFEHPPYNNSSLRSVYHTRQIDVWRLKHLSPIDIFLSHDWPTGIWEHGDVNALLHRKPFFRDDIQSYRLGSAAAAELLEQLQPNYWFSAHLHVRFAAYLRHKSGANTRFLALDKVLPGRRFLQLLDVESRSDEPLSLDPEWLCILRNTDSAAVPSHAPVFLPPISKPTEEEIAEIRATFMDTFRLPENFERTAPTLSEEQNGSKPASWYSNPQTELLCKMVGLRRPFGAPTSLAGMHLPPPSKNPDEIVLDDDDGNNDDDEMVEGSLSKKTETSAPIANPDEIPLGDSDEEQQNE